MKLEETKRTIKAIKLGFPVAQMVEHGSSGFPVAQMVEHGASNAKIMGSIPRESKS